MKEVIFAGLGGQGVLTVGRIVAEIANHRGDNVTWLPSYGSAMRGGAANCTVKYGKEPIWNPAQEGCNLLLAMHSLSLAQFQDKVLGGGIIVYNSDIIKEEECRRHDLHYLPVACSSLAAELGAPRGANIIMTGAVIRASGDFSAQEGLDGMNAMFRHLGKSRFEEQNCVTFKAGFDCVKL